MSDGPSKAELRAELEDLRARLAEVEEVLRGVRYRALDAMPIAGDPTDVAEPNDHHEQIVAAERLARLILEQAAEGIVVCDELGRVIRVSQAAERLSDSPLSRPFIEAFPLRTDPSARFQLDQILQGVTLRNLDVALDREGHQLALILNAGPLLCGERIIGCVVTLTDITGRKRAEEALRESVKELTCLVAVNRDIQQGLSIHELCRRAVEHLIPAMRFPEIAVAVIEFGGERFASRNDIDGLSHSLHAEIRTNGDLLGHVRVGYLDEKPFLIPEEQNLVDLIAEILSTYFARARAEETLVASEKKYRDLVETAHDLIWAVDAQGRITFLNQAARTIYGYAPEELVGRCYFDLLPPEHRARHAESFPKMLAGGKAYQGGIETEVLDRNGNRHTLIANAIIQYDQQGNPIGSMGTSTDITEPKRAEAEIRERGRLSALDAAIGLSLTETDSLSRALQHCAQAFVTHLDAAIVKIWTVDEREGVLELQARAGLDTHAGGPHGNVPLGQATIEGIARDRKPYVTNAVIGDPQVHDQDWARRERIVAFAGHPLIVNDRLVGVVALFARHLLAHPVVEKLASLADHIALGIDHQRKAEALRTAEERMRFALDSANVGIWDMDHTTGLVRWSETIEAHHGLQPGTLGENFEAFVKRIHPDDRAYVLETVGEAMKSGGDFSFENRMIWPDGTVRWLRGAGRVHLGENGEPVRTVGISMDVTERHALEQQYQQAQKMEAVGRLAGGVAHDFNNLLTAILGYCDMLLADIEPNDPRRTDVAEIQKAGEAAAGLTRQLLAFSRKQIIEPTLLDLNAVVVDMRTMLGRLIRQDVTVVLGLAPELAPIKADRGQVEQIIVNLAVNARDAMPHGGTLTIETANVELDEDYAKMHLSVKPGPYVALTVSDTGVGMTSEVQARMFEPFFTTKEIGKGTGLGLATVDGIVAQSGGSVEVYSEVGKGTSFKVYFPRAAAAKGVVEADEEPAAARPHPDGGETVLVVDDAEPLRELARRLLQRQGYTVLVAANAEEARQLFERNPSIDVLLTDVVMPGASGPELTRQLVEQRPSLKVIYMSGYTENAIQQGVLDRSVSFLHKPFSSDALGRKMREVLDHS